MRPWRASISFTRSRSALRRRNRKSSIRNRRPGRLISALRPPSLRSRISTTRLRFAKPDGRGLSQSRGRAGHHRDAIPANVNPLLSASLRIRRCSACTTTSAISMPSGCAPASTSGCGFSDRRRRCFRPSWFRSFGLRFGKPVLGARAGVSSNKRRRSGWLNAQIVQQLVQRIDRRIGMPVELIAFRASEGFHWPRARACGPACPFIRDEAHHRVAVMPGGLIGHQFARLIADGAEQNHPGQHFRVAHFVQLLVVRVPAARCYCRAPCARWPTSRNRTPAADTSTRPG
jgi:hypothetical protein